MFHTISFKNPEPPRVTATESMLRTITALRKAGLEDNAAAIERAMDKSQPGWRALAAKSGAPAR